MLSDPFSINNHPELEVVVVDDGSTDGTPQVLSRFEGRIRVLEQHNQGVAAARNLALGEARGDLIAFQDADDLWVPGRLGIQEDRFRARPELEMCVGTVQNFWMADVVEEEAAYRGHRFADPLPGYCLPCLLARKSLFDRVGRFDTSLRTGSDNDWFLRARDSDAVEELVPEILLRRRLHAHNLTRADLASRGALLRNMKASLDRKRERRSD